MHGTILSHGDSNHNLWSYKVKLINSGRVITRNVKRLRCTDIMIEMHLKDVK